MERIQIPSGELPVICQPWAYKSSSEIRYAGFSLHLNFDSVARYLLDLRHQMPLETPTTYTWIDWRQPAFRTGVAGLVAVSLYNTEDWGLRFDSRYELPPELKD